MGKTKIKKIDSDQLSELSQSIIDSSVTEKPTSENQKQKTDNGKKKPGKARVRGKKYQEAVKLVNRSQKYPFNEAVRLARQTSYSKFPGTLEAHINTTAKNIRGLVSLPHFSGKALTILAFGPLSLRPSGQAGVIWGDDETIAEIEGSKLKFDVLVTTPEWMPKLAKVAKVLGPRGLMPNPKNGTITDNLTKAITELKSGKIEYKTESNNNVIHLPIGKVDQPTEEITANMKSLYEAIGKSKVKSLTLTATMGPGIKVSLPSI